MSNEKLKHRIKTYTDFSNKIMNRMIDTTEILNVVLKKHGETKENLALIEQFYLMKIHEFELLLFAFNQIAFDPGFKELENDEVTLRVVSLKSTIIKSISDAKNELKSHINIVKESKKSVPKPRRSDPTKALLNSIGLR
jgi:hypothetical protein